MLICFMFSGSQKFKSYGLYDLPFEVSCKGCYLFNVDTQMAVYEKNKDNVVGILNKKTANCYQNYNLKSK